MAATMVITSKVRCADAALQIVSDGPGPLDAITRGNSAEKTAATTARIPSELSANARPPRPIRTSGPDAAMSAPDTTASVIGTVPGRAPRPGDPPAASHAAVATVSAPADGDSQKATSRARPASGPPAFADSNVAPR